MLRICRVERRGDEHEVNSHFCAWCQTLASYPPAVSPLAMRALRSCLAAALDSLSPRREAGVSFLLEKMVVVFIQRRAFSPDFGWLFGKSHNDAFVGALLAPWLPRAHQDEDRVPAWGAPWG